MKTKESLIISVLCIGLVAMTVGAGTLAYFIDTETSISNSFTAGTLDLKVSDTDEASGDGVSATWIMNNMKPGDTDVGPFAVTLRNSGSIAGDHVEISFSHTIDEISNPVESDTNDASSPEDLAKWIEITTMTYDGTNFVSDFVANDPNLDPNNNGFFDLEDVMRPEYSGEGGFLDNQPVPLPQNSIGSRTFMMGLDFHMEATNDIQGDILTTTVTFVLNQDSSQ